MERYTIRETELIQRAETMFLPIRDKNRTLIAAGLLLIISLTLYGCTTSNYGKLESRKSVAQKFMSNQIRPNYKYYFAGVRSQPTAIVGINPNYELIDRMWTEIDPESNDFSVMIDRVLIRQSDFRYQAWGFVILDPEGKEAGVWYSTYRSAAIRFNDNRQINKLKPMGQRAIGDQR